jgi:hypothetical protein
VRCPLQMGSPAALAGDLPLLLGRHGCKAPTLLPAHRLLASGRIAGPRGAIMTAASDFVVHRNTSTHYWLDLWRLAHARVGISNADGNLYRRRVITGFTVAGSCRPQPCHGRAAKRARGAECASRIRRTSDPGGRCANPIGSTNVPRREPERHAAQAGAVTRAIPRKTAGSREAARKAVRCRTRRTPPAD